ncbi:hypothetical protein LCGC14_1100450, partial [marine sediment metagenome]
GNDLTSMGNIALSADNTFDIGASGTELRAIYSNNFISAGTMSIGSVGATTTAFTTTVDGIVVSTTASPNLWQTATFSLKNMAVETITQLNELATAGADYSMGGFGFTNVDDIAGVAANTLELISTDTDEATAEGFRINWDANVSALTDNATTLSIGFTNDSDVFIPQYKFRVDSTFGPALTCEGTGTWKGIVGYGAASGRRTGFAFGDALIRVRVADTNTFEFGAAGLKKWCWPSSHILFSSSSNYG